MRKLATAAAVSLALATSGAFGLGLGDIEMRSALNQPMNAEIRLTSVKPGELDGMIVQIASPEAFARAGIERSTALTDLRFTVEPGSGVIRITSQRPVIEPFLNFLLEVDWPQGRMVREYTVLLDPPVFMTPSATRRNSSADQAVVVERGNEALVVPTPIERSMALDSAADEGIAVDLAGLNAEADAGEVVSLDLLSGASSSGSGTFTLDEGDIVSLTDAGAPNTAALAQRQREAREAFDLASIEVELVDSTEEVDDTTFITERAVSRRESDGSTIVSLDDLSAGSIRDTAAQVSVNRGDTLFEIARDNAIRGVSIQQMMLALLAANESAFINNNINLVRAGAILRIPDAGSARRLTQAQALASIGEQNQLWQEYRDNLRNTGATQVATARRDTDRQGSGARGSAVSTRDTAASDLASTAAADTSAVEAALETAALDSETSSDGLSAEARAILEEARREILNRDELRIVADNAPTSTAVSATADENGDNDAQRLGEVNRRLQLAREELSATRLQSAELSDQAGELQNTSENLDALLTLRQDEIAQLEAQLANVRSAGEAAGSATQNLVADADSAISGARAGAGGTAAVAANAALGSTDMAAQSVGALAGAGDKMGDAVDSGVNALTEAGETLGVVELLEDANPSTAATGSDAGGIDPPVRQTTWYEDFLNDPMRLMIAGIGGVALLGVLGTLLYRRKRRDNDEMLDIMDEAEFMDEENDETGFQPKRAASDEASAQSAVSRAAGAAAGAAGVVGGASLAGLAGEREAPSDSASKAGAGQRSIDFDKMADSSLAFGSETQAVANAHGEPNLDKDDTISEVDVYLAYGLHGQAEELLSKAIERAPDNPRYAHKLLQTYHAQGNGEAFQNTAAEFHARFGGEDNPEWPAIAAMGVELRPDDPLFASALDTVSTIGVGHSYGQGLGDDDFLPALDDENGSFNRNFRSSNSAAAAREDESSLMDDSLDPAFAFDEGDLEATGDFTGIASELAAEEEDGGIDFPGFSATASDTEDLTDEFSSGMNRDGDLLGDALTLDELDRVASADDLTLDLDQLSGDLELDSAELMNADLSDLDLPELTIDNELLVDGLSSVGNADEMDTMLDLARAYIDMGDKDSASSALDEIVRSGSPEQVTEAETLLHKIS